MKRVVTQETRDKISKTKKNKKVVAWNKGVPMSEEQKQHLSKVKKQRFAEGKTKHWNTGKTTSEEVKEKIKKKLLSKNLTYSEESKQKRLLTYERKKEEGWIHHSTTEEWKDKIKQTSIKRYGTDNPAQSPEIKEKAKQTNIERYGVDNPMKSPEIQKKLREYWQNRYLVDNPMSSKEVWSRRLCNSSSNSLSSEELEKVFDNLNNKELLIDLHHNKEKSLKEIGILFGIPYHSVAWFLKKHDIEIKYYFSSLIQKEITYFIKSLYDGEIKENDRKIISPYELDIFLPDLNLGFEINGIFWHSERCGVSKNYHQLKTKLAKDKNILLIHIFENEWIEKEDLVKSKIRTLLNRNKRIFARQCYIAEIDGSGFFEKNHLQGSVTQKQICYGLIKDDVIVSAMSFGKPRFDKNNECEMIRFANIQNITIVGGASRLLKHYIKIHNPQSIISYCDERWSYGKLYKNLGFTYSHNTKPNYYYFKLPNLKLYNRITFQKHKLHKILDVFDENLTEWENMKNNDYNRIWDCGNSVWMWKQP